MRDVSKDGFQRTQRLTQKSASHLCAANKIYCDEKHGLTEGACLKSSRKIIKEQTIYLCNDTCILEMI